jgi:hypothetical protein
MGWNGMGWDGMGWDGTGTGMIIKTKNKKRILVASQLRKQDACFY